MFVKRIKQILGVEGSRRIKLLNPLQKKKTQSNITQHYAMVIYFIINNWNFYLKIYVFKNVFAKTLRQRLPIGWGRRRRIVKNKYKKCIVYKKADAYQKQRRSETKCQRKRKPLSNEHKYQLNTFYEYI